MLIVMRIREVVQDGRVTKRASRRANGYDVQGSIPTALLEDREEAIISTMKGWLPMAKKKIIRTMDGRRRGGCSDENDGGRYH